MKLGYHLLSLREKLITLGIILINKEVGSSILIDPTPILQ